MTVENAQLISPQRQRARRSERIQANKWNHAGILLEGNMLLHHLYGHLSQRVPYGGYWQDRTIAAYRTADT